MSESTLLDFFVAYLEWVDAGAPEESGSDETGFSRASGLCYNALRFAARYPGSRSRLTTDLTLELLADFGQQDFVFGSPQDYREMRVSNSAHLHRPRIEWVKKKIVGLQNNG